MSIHFDWIQDFFQIGPIPANAIAGRYSLGLVVLSYVIAVLASYVALDLAGRLRTEEKPRLKIYWLLGGAFAMGAGIWSMHFIGMLAFIMPMSMGYDLFWTGLSLLIAIGASAFALYLLRSRTITMPTLILGGSIFGIAIISMHYTGMQGMTYHVNIHYIFSIFLLSILIAILAAIAALWLAIRSNKGTYRRQLVFKVSSAFVMGAAICGMHYTGMWAAVFTPREHMMMTSTIFLEPSRLAFDVAAVTGVIIGLALLLSTYKQLMVSAVQKEKNFLNAMLDNLEDGIIASDSKGKITLINRTLLNKLSLPSGYIHNIKDFFNYFNLYPLNDRRKFSEKNNPLGSALRGKKIRNLELTMMIKKNNSYRDIVLHSQPIKNLNGEALGAVVVIHDITERRKVEKLKNEFVSIVSHELRTPLTSIRGSLGLITGGVAGKLNEKAENLLQIASNNCERLIRLINDILDIEKIEAGKMEFLFEPYYVSQLVEEAIKENQSFALKYNVKIELERPVPAAQIKVDHDRFIQAITNLISNAVKFSPAGSAVKITATQDQGWIKIHVTDRGKGIPEEFQKRIFQKFAQADASTMRQQGGTGLGLSISKTIVEKMAGLLSFTTKKDVGTTFTIQLPIWQERRLTSAGEEAPKGNRILICEDDKDFANLLSVILTDHGFHVTVSNSIAEAKTLLKKEKFDAMTLDLLLPDGNGIDLIKELRQSLNYKALPIVVISGKINGNRQLINGDAINILDWLNKPIDTGELIIAINHIKTKLKKEKPRILHIEDDPDIMKVTQDLVGDNVYYQGVTTLADAKKILAEEKFDLVLLDLMLPDGSGVELLPLFSRMHIPVIVFSAFDLPKDYAKYVNSVLTKSQTTNNELLAAIKAAI